MFSSSITIGNRKFDPRPIFLDLKTKFSSVSVGFLKFRQKISISKKRCFRPRSPLVIENLTPPPHLFRPRKLRHKPWFIVPSSRQKDGGVERGTTSYMFQNQLPPPGVPPGVFSALVSAVPPPWSAKSERFRTSICRFWDPVTLGGVVASFSERYRISICLCPK